MRKALLTTLLLAAIAPASAAATAPGPIVYGYADQGGQVQTEVAPPTPGATPDVRPEVLGRNAESGPLPASESPASESPQPAEPSSAGSSRSDSEGRTGSTLPFTGQDIGVLALVGLVLLCLGMTLRGVSRPRGPDSGPPPGLGALDPAGR